MIVDRYVSWKLKRNPDAFMQLHADLISARMGITLNRFLQICLISALLAGFSAGIAAALFASLIYIPRVSIQIYNVFNLQLPSYYIPQLNQTNFAILAFFVIFILLSFISYHVMIRYPSIKKASRTTKINLSLHNAVSYMFAMRRGGAEMLDIFRSMSENAVVYGEVAIEFRQVLRDAEYFGHDLISALENLSMTTPSEKLKDFLEDLVSVTGSGGNISEYLEGRVRMYQEEARFEQLQFLSTLQIVAEAYVTVFVAGPLFLVIIMVVMGMVGSSAVLEFALVTYVLLPIGAVIFILFIDMMSLSDEVAERYTRITEMKQFIDVPIEDKEDDVRNYKALDWYDRLKAIRGFLTSPFDWFIVNANRTLYFTVPLALIYIIAVYLVTPQYSDTELYIAVVDDHVIIAMLIVILPYAVFFEFWRRKLKSIESSIPDFLERLSGINRVGLTIAGAINVLVKANLGLISYEIRRIKRDLEWGASVNDALIRFEERVNTAAIARTVTLITKASEMTGDIGEVLGIASADARMSETLKKERQGEMFIYTVIIYLAFFVFIFVVAVLNTNFLEILEQLSNMTTSSGSSIAGASEFSMAANMDVDVFRRLLYHTCLIQAIFSGIIAGQMGEGMVKSGIKHAGIMLIIALVIFNLFI
ncbi:Type II secretion system F domain protein [Methanolacinia petrolearia DSM 11571]|uniref:Type II secretion system F domain protein n=1 Tax=Methanolacinia petrolearia (strain DSM 11571 / OCM 486 / SEBR 4847) TaxID=679926 RepID=E1REQ1_METP4|nr:type II secretion system F family protein [Methanolacinia petrolearia]ADN34998.1 Type II secretion system F domain protein [Methanolacinia petrolearia DSM 11571]